jgi:hypothetical protein
MTRLRTIVFAVIFALCGATDAFAVCTGQFQAGSVCANAGASQALPGPTANPVLGLPGTTAGSLGFAGVGSGTATVQAQSAAGTPTLLWPTVSGTLVSTASAPLVLNSVTGAVSITGAAGQVLAGASPAFTATPVLGASGTAGTIGFGNATSGTVTLGTVTGALGSVTASLPANTGVIAETNFGQTWTAAQTFNSGASVAGLTVTSSFTATGLVTNADLTNSSITLGSTAMALGSTNTTIAGAISWSGIQSITNNTASTSPSTGAVVVTGGVGITGAIYSLGSISTTGSDSSFAAGGNRAMMDVTGTTARIGAVYGGGSAMSLSILCGSASTCLSISSAGLVSIGSGLTVTSSFTATGLVTNADLVNSSITLGTTAMSLGSAYTTIAGAITWSGSQTFSAAMTYGGVTLSNSVTGTGNMVLSASPTFSGTVAGANTIPLTVLQNQSANVILGTTSAGAVAALTINSGASCTNALTWTNGTGFGCNVSAGTGTVTSATIAAGTGISVTGTCAITTSGTCTVATSLSTLTNTLSGDVALSNVSNYFDGPSVAQGTTGTWCAMGTVTVIDTSGAANYDAKLWDGTTIIASAFTNPTAASLAHNISLSGCLATPAGNIRISVKDTTFTTGDIKFNLSGNSKDSTITVFRVQ